MKKLFVLLALVPFMASAQDHKEIRHEEHKAAVRHEMHHEAVRHEEHKAAVRHEMHHEAVHHDVHHDIHHDRKVEEHR